MLAAWVTLPKFFESSMLVTGTAHTGVFVALNISNRNSIRKRSVNGNSRKMERSRFLPQSERSEFRPRFPKVFAVGSWNEEVLIHPLGPLLLGSKLPTTFRRS